MLKLRVVDSQPTGEKFEPGTFAICLDGEDGKGFYAICTLGPCGDDFAKAVNRLENSVRNIKTSIEACQRLPQPSKKPT